MTTRTMLLATIRDKLMSSSTEDARSINISINLSMEERYRLMLCRALDNDFLNCHRKILCSNAP